MWVLFMLSVQSQISDLFTLQDPTSLNVVFKDVDQNRHERITKILSHIGLFEKVTRIQQPVGQGEINSKNFKIELESGKVFVLRECQKYRGSDHYQRLALLLQNLKEDGVRVPTLETPILGMGSYFEVMTTEEKTCWVFFKYIEAETYFSGKQDDLEGASEQIGRMHASLKRRYAGVSLYEKPHQSPAKPFLTLAELLKYHDLILQKADKDQFDELLLANFDLIKRIVQVVELNFDLVYDPLDIQNIHYDLNSKNLMIKGNHVYLMDFDDVRLGNVNTDIGFALHRLITTCMEQGVQDIQNLVDKFSKGYQRGNVGYPLNNKKIVVALYDRALQNLKVNLEYRYDQNSDLWLSSLPINIKRLKQIEMLAEYLNP